MGQETVAEQKYWYFPSVLRAPRLPRHRVSKRQIASFELGVKEQGFVFPVLRLLLRFLSQRVSSLRDCRFYTLWWLFHISPDFFVLG